MRRRWCHCSKICCDNRSDCECQQRRLRKPMNWTCEKRMTWRDRTYSTASDFSVFLGENPPLPREGNSYPPNPPLPRGGNGGVAKAHSKNTGAYSGNQNL